MINAVASKLEGESVSVIPATANGHASAHPEVVVASDSSKGLAIEAERLAIADKAQRPPIERFVTALEG